MCAMHTTQPRNNHIMQRLFNRGLHAVPETQQIPPDPPFVVAFVACTLPVSSFNKYPSSLHLHLAAPPSFAFAICSLVLWLSAASNAFSPPFSVSAFFCSAGLLGSFFVGSPPSSSACFVPSLASETGRASPVPDSCGARLSVAREDLTSPSVALSEGLGEGVPRFVALGWSPFVVEAYDRRRMDEDAGGWYVSNYFEKGCSC